MNRRIPFVSLVTAMIMLSIPCASWGTERVRVIDWGNLLSPTSTEFDDPFLKLAEPQLFKLRQPDAYCVDFALQLSIDRFTHIYL